LTHPKGPKLFLNFTAMSELIYGSKFSSMMAENWRSVDKSPIFNNSVSLALKAEESCKIHLMKIKYGTLNSLKQIRPYFAIQLSNILNAIFCDLA
jgi:hypothetical protein